MKNLRTLWLLRCTEKQYADSFCKQGNIKFNTPRIWIKMEEECGKGRGDANEGVFSSHEPTDAISIMQSSKLRQDIECYTKERITYLRSKDILDLPCFCLYGLHNTNFTESSIDKAGIVHHIGCIAKEYFEDFGNDITKEDMDKIAEENQPVLVMINNPHEFFNRVREFFISLGAKPEEILISPVIYMDKKQPFYCNLEYPYELFLKDLEFSKQSEVRIIINTKNKKVLEYMKDNNNIVNIGDLRDITNITKYYFDDMQLDLSGNSLLYSLSEPEYTPLEDYSFEELLAIAHQVYRGDAPGVDNPEEINSIIDEIKKIIKNKYNISVNIENNNITIHY